MCVKAWMADDMTLENMRSEYLFFSYYQIESKKRNDCNRGSKLLCETKKATEMIFPTIS